ncbi:hypothetical protein BC827DRAFT_69496 [Russula dissimulans]|nr:hypothetical protein BC827DRAFT_69496 [Russula dissimulans]
MFCPNRHGPMCLLRYYSSVQPVRPLNSQRCFLNVMRNTPHRRLALFACKKKITYHIMSRIEGPNAPTSFYVTAPPRPQRQSSYGPHRHHDHDHTTATPAHTAAAPEDNSPSLRQRRHRHKTTTAESQSQMTIFRTAAPPILFAILVAGLVVELRAYLATPLPTPPPGVAVSARGNTVMQRALIWAEGRWPGAWALPVLCASALGALRAIIWAGAAVFDRLEEPVEVSDAARVRVGRWEEGGTVSGSELLAGMFT